MKIVQTDNFGGDYPDEKFVDGLPYLSNSECGIAKAWEICHAIQAAAGGEMADRYWKVVKDDYILVPGFEP